MLRCSMPHAVCSIRVSMLERLTLGMCTAFNATALTATALDFTTLVFTGPPSLQGVYIAGVLQLRRPCSIAQTTQDAAGAAHCSLPAAAGVGASVRITSLCVQQTSRPAAGRLPPRQRQLRPSLPHRVAPHPHTYIPRRGATARNIARPTAVAVRQCGLCGCSGAVCPP